MDDSRCSLLGDDRRLVAYQSYRDLDIYSKAHKLAVEIHELSLKWPKFEMYEQASQIRRSSKSIKSNIVEGFGRRRYKREFVRFLTFSLASCDETRDHLDTLYETESLRYTEKYKYFCEEYDHLARMISNFIKSVQGGHKTRIQDQESRIEDG